MATGVAGALALCAAAWASAETAQGGTLPAPYKIVCTTGMVADIATHVAGERAQVESIIGAGVDPHLYQATRTDVAKLIRADVIFYSGLMLEGKMGDALVKVGRTRPVYAVTELIDESLLLEPDGFNGHFDPHLWMDVSLWKRCAELVARTLAELDPDHADEYTANFKRYAAELDRLHAYVGEVFSSIPASSRVLVTAHDAFNYMGRAYGIEVRGIQGISTESEAGISDINTLVDMLVDRDIKAVFVESSVSDRNVRSLLEGAQARGHTVTIGGSLFSDAMGKAGEYEGTYIGMIDHNATTIARALGGSPPPRGMQGKLADGS
jgi:manganese/zinc/iron transport system substrate-binding protein